jgi:predicted Kef-type K+ transport protein
MLLMFGVGLHFSLRDLLDVRKIALPGAVLQIAVATAMGMGMAYMWGWSLGAGLVFGLALSVASTVVLLRALEGPRHPRLDEWPHRGRLAGGRGPGHGAGAGAAAGAGRSARRQGRRRRGDRCVALVCAR